jgi:hypothetical protein
MKSVRRGYEPKDLIEFGEEWEGKLNSAAEELVFLLNRGYHIKSASTFVGNHYMLSERQRNALSRMVVSEKQLVHRKNKELCDLTDIVHIDAFNSIITLEVALSESLLIRGLDGTIRDLAGLRGTYRIIDKTEPAIRLILSKLDQQKVDNAIFYLDKPVSNSGRLSALILETAQDYQVNIAVEVITDVDRTLEKLDHVVTSDAIILDKCISWFNLIPLIIEELDEMTNHDYLPWIFHLFSEKEGKF